ncbi:MAG: heavy metal translocating P-type ATPase [Pseudomonadota bacterium]
MKRNTAGQPAGSDATGAPRCHHCAEVIPEGQAVIAASGDKTRSFCCHGCRAAADLIIDSGLGAFYRLRNGDELDNRITPVGEVDTEHWRAYDSRAALESYTSELENGRREIRLSVPQIYCSACSWLLDRKLSQIEAVEDILIAPEQRQMRLRWRADITPLSDILIALAEIGYPARPLATGESARLNREENRSALKRLAVAGLGMMQIMTYAASVYLGDYQGIEEEFRRFFHLVSLLVATLVVFYAGAPFFSNAWRDLRARHLGMDVPVALAIGGAYTASVWNTLSDNGQAVYFDSAVMFIFFLSIGRYVEMRTRHRAQSSADALEQLLPPLVGVKRGSETLTVAPSALRSGDRLSLGAGDIVPGDGEITGGDGRFDEALISGESRPRYRTVGDDVIGGAKLVDGAVDLRIISQGKDSTLAQMQSLMDRARGQRPRLQLLASSVARYFVTGLLLIAAITGIYWWHTDPDNMLPILISVLVVTCPCALSLAVPTALTAAGQGLSHHGILVASGDALETLPRIDHWCFDKTGTLTSGHMQVVRVHRFDGPTQDSEHALLALAARLEAGVSHPIASAFVQHGNAPLESAEYYVGRGVEATINGCRFRLGEPDWAAELRPKQHLFLPDTTRPLVMLTSERQWLALFELSEDLRDGAAETIQALSRQGQVSILSGDGEGSVASVSAELGIGDWRARQQPRDKVEAIRQLQQRGHKVAMVGDGANDAPVLAQADVTVALANGSQLAQTAADVILLSPRLDALLTLKSSARRTRRIIRQNMAWALLYNLTALPLAASGLIAPWMAAIGMSASSLIVVLNATRLRRVVPPEGSDT